MDRAGEMGNCLEKKILALEELPMVGDIRGKGMLWAIDFIKDKAAKEPFAKERQNGRHHYLCVGCPEGGRGSTEGFLL